MNEPTRLLEGDLPADIADMLRSTTSDLAPAEEADEKRRICETAAESRLWAAAPPPSRARPNVAWIGLAAAILAVGAAAVHYADSPRVANNVAPEQVGSSADTHTVVTPAPVATAATDTDSTPSVAALPSMRVDELPPARAAASSALPSVAPPVVAAARTPSRPTANVADELALIDAARGALSSGQPAAAYSHIQRYHASFPAPHFVNEADALEVQALAALGRDDEARTKAERFLEAHPHSPYTQRVRAAAGLSSGGAADTRH